MPTLCESQIAISIVVPVYHGESTLRELTMEIARMAADWVAHDLPITLHEVIFVNDGATDNSALVLCDLQQNHPWMQILTMPRNSGQHAATIAGIRQTAGDWIVTLDEDLQHHPRNIRALLAYAATNRLDLVYARPMEAVHQSPFRDGSSRLIKAALAAITGNSRIPHFNSFRLIRGELARAAAATARERAYFDVTLCDFTALQGTHSIAMKDHRYIEQRFSGWTPRALIAHAWRMLIQSRSSRARGLAIAILPASLWALVLLGSAAHRAWMMDRHLRGWGDGMCFLGLTASSAVVLVLFGLALDYLISSRSYPPCRPVSLTMNRSKDELLASLNSETPA